MNRLLALAAVAMLAGCVKSEVDTQTVMRVTWQGKTVPFITTTENGKTVVITELPSRGRKERP